MLFHWSGNENEIEFLSLKYKEQLKAYFVFKTQKNVISVISSYVYRIEGKNNWE